jgi:hypothetical protein
MEFIKSIHPECTSNLIYLIPQIAQLLDLPERIVVHILKVKVAPGFGKEYVDVMNLGMTCKKDCIPSYLQ